MHLLLETFLKAEYLHITVAVVGPFKKPSPYALLWRLGALWKQSTYILQLLLGPFESKALTNYSCYWRPHWKWSSLLTHCRCCWGPFESRVPVYYTFWKYWKYYIESRILADYSCCWWPVARQSTWLWCALENIIWTDNDCFTKKEENLCAKRLESGPYIGGPEASASP